MTKHTFECNHCEKKLKLEGDGKTVAGLKKLIAKARKKGWFVGKRHIACKEHAKLAGLSDVLGMAFDMM